jgi:uncharacterized protein
MPGHTHTNALISETSPYLLQHAHNPVDWLPWNEEALRKARVESKPILLSVGYSACHWCHVMERESFENEDIAALMNRYFIPIKVDREERPDLDAIYMSAVQMMTGQGGWPMTVFLTPEGVPFYGGTYFPPEDRHGMPGFRRILGGVAAAWSERRGDILRDAGAIAAELDRQNEIPSSTQEAGPEHLDSAAKNLLERFDIRLGGFSGAPKFPPSMAASFLLRSYRRTGNKAALEAVEVTLENMAAGGIYDQLGGGFHRYSTDQQWLVPHFEKMLYDNALLSRLYLDAWLVTGKPVYRKVVEGTLDYVLREMTSPEGGFYSSQDADSDGHEGVFFVWTPAEVKAVLGPEEGELFCHYFDVTDSGNFEGRNILHVSRSLGAAAKLPGVDEGELARAMETGCRRLFAAREHRVKPARDEKILTAWNGMMLRSMAEAAVVLDRQDYRAAAVKNADFLLANLRRGERLLRSYKGGRARFDGYLEDYACLADGLLALYQATFEPRWYREALGIAGQVLDLFSDPAGGALYFTASDHERLIQRPRDFYDNATPSGNSVAAEVFLRVWKFTGDDRWRKRAAAAIDPLSIPMSRYPAGFGQLLCALDLALTPGLEIAITGFPDASETRRLLREVFGRYLPNKVVACGLPDSHPLLEKRPMVGNLATAYVCCNSVCSRPVTVSSELATLLAEGDAWLERWT